MSEAVIAYGATVERSTDGTTYTSIPEAKGIAVPATVRDYVEVTNLDSPNGYREYIKGLRDAGELSVPANYTPDGYEQQISDSEEAGAIYYRVTMPPSPSQLAGDRFTFRGFPTPSLSGDDIGGVVEMTVNLRITGDPVRTAGVANADGATLSAPTGTETGATTATGSVTTNVGSGTLYAGVFPTATTPTEAEIKAGTGATYATSDTTPTVGVNNFSATGLTTATAYKWHFVQETVGAVDSNIATSAEFTTD